MNTEQLDIFIKIGIFLLILSIICRIAVGILYKVLVSEAERMEKTKNLILCRLRTGIRKKGIGIRGNSKKRICVEQCLKEVKVGGVALRFLPSISFYCMLLAILAFGIGAYLKMRDGVFLLESFPYYIAAFAAVYVYSFVATMTDYEASKELLKEQLTDYLEELQTIDFQETKRCETEPEEIKVGNLTKKSRNREREKLLKEFLS